jgi:hypothetical protein
MSPEYHRKEPNLRKGIHNTNESAIGSILQLFVDIHLKQDVHKGPPNDVVYLCQYETLDEVTARLAYLIGSVYNHEKAPGGSWVSLAI